MAFLCLKFLRGLLRIRLFFRFRDALQLAEYFHKFLAGNGFILIEVLGNLIQDTTVFPQQPDGSIIALLEDPHDFLVNLGCGFLPAVQAGPAVQILALDRHQPHQPKLL